jgi:hypothetical protein
MKTFNVPMLVTGGGGYTKSNVARCWALETAVLTDTEIEDDLPDCTYLEYFGPEYKLHTLKVAAHRDMPQNANNQSYVDSLQTEVRAQLFRTPADSHYDQLMGQLTLFSLE